MNITQIAITFDLSRDTVRKRLRAANVGAAMKGKKREDLYDMAIAGPALFS
ncbi:DUF1441 family protein [Vibrio parahaemolyticus]|uniref:DUF1441 family protein n=1 Tax=Vibrio parahaemolyticus TaxID=670 RepID=UPI001A2B45F9|nr:DUF1441 family protein [Vibrio parahaemolyticus]MCC3798241.1 hypothetical protein [Vibrio parahaemolyticus]HAS6073699.1 hypothetical protein [Vibrio vulnificus]